MRIWDIDPGFLNDKSLLGEHRELHGIVSILINNKKGYSRHPETLRWQESLGSLAVRHQLLVAEITLRGFNHRSPLPPIGGAVKWPVIWINSPPEQYQLLRQKYLTRKPGRIPLPRNEQSLWATHKYSVMARDYNAYRRYGPLVATGGIEFVQLAQELVAWLRCPPSAAALNNSLLHMWGYVASLSAKKPAILSTSQLLSEIQRVVMGTGGPEYLRQSTAIGELAYWCREEEEPGKREGALIIVPPPRWEG